MSSSSSSSSYGKAVTIPNRELKEKYFYPVQNIQGYNVYVATDEVIPSHKTPARLIMDRDTCVVYLVDPNGMLYMQPQEMFPKEILNAPLFKTIPLPTVKFQQMLTPPPSPPRTTTSASSASSGRQRAAAASMTTAPAPAPGASSSSFLDTYTGSESSQWVQRRASRESAEIYYPATASSYPPSAAAYTGQHPSTYYPSQPNAQYLQYPNGVVFVSSGATPPPRPTSSRSEQGHSYSQSAPQAISSSKRVIKHVRFASQ